MKLVGRQILYASTNHAWSYGWTFYQMLAVALARENDVVYLDAPVSLARLRGADWRLLAGARVVPSQGERLRILRTATLPAQRTERLRQAAARLTAFDIARWASRDGFRPDLVWTYVPYSLPVAERFPRATVVYWTGDEVVVPGEERLLKRADAILCVSEPVFERHRARFGDRAHFVPVACDFERYDREREAPSPGPGLLDGAPRPIVGYSGWLNERVDVELLLRVAARLGDGTLALVGPVRGLARDGLAALRAARNVLLLGPQPPEFVPALIRMFDVALIPYRDTEFNRNSNPVKFYEYLALGKPVVSTDIPTLRRFRAVSLIGDRETFPDRVLEALASGSGSVDARVEVAREHSFDALLERLRALPL